MQVVVKSIRIINPEPADLPGNITVFISMYKQLFLYEPASVLIEGCLDIFFLLVILREYSRYKKQALQ
jgi:hypothetical protein